jgi:hypothetical protein
LELGNTRVLTDYDQKSPRTLSQAYYLQFIVNEQG